MSGIFREKGSVFFFVCTMLDDKYFIHFSNFAEILLAYSNIVRIFALDFGACLLSSGGR